MAFRVLLPHTEGTFTFYSIKDFIAEFLFFSLGPTAGSGILLTDNLICETRGCKSSNWQRSIQMRNHDLFLNLTKSFWRLYFRDTAGCSMLFLSWPQNWPCWCWICRGTNWSTVLIIKGLLWIFLRICLASILIKPKPQVWNLWLISGHIFNVKLRWFLPRSSQCLAHYLRVLSHQGARTDLSTLDPKVQFVWLICSQVYCTRVRFGTVPTWRGGLRYGSCVLSNGLHQVWSNFSHPLS